MMVTRLVATLAVLGSLMAPACFAEAQIGGSSNAADSTSRPLFGIEIDSNSRYVWRSVVLSRREVVQPSISSELWGTTFSVWGNLPVRDPEADGIDEIDWATSRGWSLGGFDLEATTALYTYPTGEASNVELQLTGGRSVGAGLTIQALGSIISVDHAGAGFVSGSISRDVPIRGATLTILARVSHASPHFVASYIADEPSGLDLVGGSASLELEVGGFALRPHLDVDRPFGKHRSLVAEDPPLVVGFAVGRQFAGQR